MDTKKAEDETEMTERTIPQGWFLQKYEARSQWAVSPLRKKCIVDAKNIDDALTQCINADSDMSNEKVS